MLIIVGNSIRGGICSVMGDRLVKLSQDNKLLYIDSNNLYGHSKMQYTPYGEFKFDKDDSKLDEILRNSDNIDVGYLIEIHLKYSEERRKKTKYFPFCPEKKCSSEDNFFEYLINLKPKPFT